MPILRWRHLPILLGAAFVIARTLAGVAEIVRPYLRIEYSLWFELAMVVGQVVVQWAVLWRRTWRERIDYAGVLMLVSGMGAVLLWPLLLWNQLAGGLAAFTGLAYFSVIVAVIFGIHVALVTRLGLPKILCVTWVLYRCAILLVAARRPW